MNIYKKLFKYVPEKRHQIYLSVFLSLIASLLFALPYFYLWKYIRDLIINKDILGAKNYAVIIVVLMIAYTFVYFLSLWASHLYAFRLETNLRKKGIDGLIDASFAFFDMNSSGKIRKIIDDNAQDTHMTVAHLIPDSIVAFLTPILMLLIAFYVDRLLGVLILAITIIGLFQFKAMTGNQEFLKSYMEALENMNSEAVEYVRGMQVVKIFRTTVIAFKSFHKAIMDYSENAYNFSETSRFPYVSFQVLFNIYITFTIPFAIYFLNRGSDLNIVLAKVIFFAAFGGIMFVSFMKIMYVSMYNMMAKTAVDKLENLYDEMDNKKLPDGNDDIFDNYDIEFKNVSFKYEDDFVVKDLSFKLKQNKTYALVGSSGGGKSTIAKLISGFYNIDDGEILIGGKNISSYSQKALMKNISFVFQNAQLFKMSIFDNIKMGNPDASDEEVFKAMSDARCDDIIAKFEDRENTIIGSKGVFLSGGEKQRIAIARAILKDANIIILDEASAAADPENEYEIQQAFTNLMKNKTVIMIAHRLSSIRNVDEILVIDDGKIIERGNDRELISKNGRYAKLQDLYSQANRWRV